MDSTCSGGQTGIEMEFDRTHIPEVVVCRPRVIGDARGHFMESFRRDALEGFVGHSIDFCQHNESRSRYGVLRGLHFQKEPHCQTKLVRVIEGEVLDVAVDMRMGSPTFRKSVSVLLTGENKKQLLVPRGFAHGFVVLSKSATFLYSCDNYYHPESDSGVSFDDPGLGIDWRIPRGDMLLSDKDRVQPLLDDAYYFDYQKNLYE